MWIFLSHFYGENYIIGPKVVCPNHNNYKPTYHKVFFFKDIVEEKNQVKKMKFYHSRMNSRRVLLILILNCVEFQLVIYFLVTELLSCFVQRPIYTE